MVPAPARPTGPGRHRARGGARPTARVEGGELSLDPRTRALVERAEDEAKRLGDENVSTEHLLAGVVPRGAETPSACSIGRRRPQASVAALQTVRGTRDTSQHPEGTYQALERYGRDLTSTPVRAARPGHRAR